MTSVVKYLLLIVSLPALLSCSSSEKRGKIVFQSNRDGNFEIYSMLDDGSDARRLTHSPSYDITPSWSPDGSRILFASDRNGNWEIFTMNASGEDVQRIIGPPGSHSSPVWVENGNKILFISTREFVNGQIYLMDKEGGGIRRMTSDSTVKDAAVMSPDGKSILYSVSGRSGNALWSMTLDDHSLSQLTPDEYSATNARFSPDGSLIVLEAIHEGRAGIYTLPCAGGALTLRSRVEDDSRTPCWCGAAHRFLYSRNGGLVLATTDSGSVTQLSTMGDRHPDWTAR
jgi:Tol biopolymer transport system component